MVKSSTYFSTKPSHIELCIQLDPDEIDIGSYKENWQNQAHHGSA